jgi:DNA recombination protein RmuC
MTQVLFLLLGVAAGVAAALVAVRSRLLAAQRGRDEERERRSAVELELTGLRASLDHERRVAAERAELKAEVTDAFKALSADALQRLQRDARDDLEQRQKAVEQIVAPLKQTLEKVDGGVRELEKARSEAYGALRAQLGSLAQTQDQLRAETANLVNALRAPAVRGRWGEIQLRRVVEAAGMIAYCDFAEQVTASAEGRSLRPDLVVNLPGAKQVIVDAKTPLAAYLDALEAADPERQRALLREHARQVRDHVGKLSAKAYWEQFEETPDFVVLFIPGDPFFAAALDQDPSLQEDAWRQRIVLATPSTLIGLLFVIAYGWRQEKVAESARAVSALGKELYERLSTFGGHLARLRKGLEGAVGAYNEAVGSLESRVLPAARRFPEHGVAISGDLPQLEPIDRTAREPQAPELTTGEVVPVKSERPTLASADDEPPERDVADAA